MRALNRCASVALQDPTDPSNRSAPGGGCDARRGFVQRPRELAGTAEIARWRIRGTSVRGHRACWLNPPDLPSPPAGPGVTTRGGGCRRRGTRGRNLGTYCHHPSQPLSRPGAPADLMVDTCKSLILNSLDVCASLTARIGKAGVRCRWVHFQLAERRSHRSEGRDPPLVSRFRLRASPCAVREPRNPRSR